MRGRWTLALMCGALVIFGAALSARIHAGTGFFDDLPHGYPRPVVPADNPLTAAKIELGRHLFYDTRLSENGAQSCATCHQQEKAFTDGRPRAIGSTGIVHPRGSMSLVNVAYASALTWGNPTVNRLEEQILTPMFGADPIELGVPKPGTTLLTRLRAEPTYHALFASAFPEDRDPYTIDNVARALASFERTIISTRSPYDRYHFDRDDSAVSAAVRHGEVLFHSQQLSCFRCHGGFNFSGATTFEGATTHEAEFHNNGLYNIAGVLSYPRPNAGVFETTGDPKDVGKFKAPTLRNIAVTAPYMHDGSLATLDDVIDHYAAGGRAISEGPLRGNGHDNPNKSPSVHGFTLTATDRADLKAFLESLTDSVLLHDPRFSNPWKRE